MKRKIMDWISKNWIPSLLLLAIGMVLPEAGNYWQAGNPNVLSFTMKTFSFKFFIGVIVFILLVYLVKLLVWLFKLIYNMIIDSFNRWFEKKLDEHINKRK